MTVTVSLEGYKKGVIKGLWTLSVYEEGPTDTSDTFTVVSTVSLPIVIIIHRVTGVLPPFWRKGFTDQTFKVSLHVV